jgi:hypothetical protein
MRGVMSFGQMAPNRKSVLIGIATIVALSALYLAYLCALDVYFVKVANEEQGWYNSAALLIFTLPIAIAAVGYKLLPKPHNVVFAFTSVPIGLAISDLELLWVATSFHSMIGGKI